MHGCVVKRCIRIDCLSADNILYIETVICNKYVLVIYFVEDYLRK